MNTLIEILALVLLGYVTISVLYQFILAAASLFSRSPLQKKDDKVRNFLILVPAYKEDAVITKSTCSNMGVHYPKDKYELVVINDGLQATTKANLLSLGADVLDVYFVKSTKVKAIKSAIQRLDMNVYDGVVILDADNIMAPDFLHQANRSIANGAVALQGQRKAANMNGTTAIFDAISETANHAMLCKGANFFGLSSKLSGSGMVFTTSVFKKIIMKSHAVGGFDKELELLLTQQGVFIKYNEEAVILDEKLVSYDAFAKQRSRWLEAQYNFLRKFIGSGMKSLASFQLDHGHKVLQLALPPRALMVVLLVITGALGFAVNNAFIYYLSIATIGINVLTYVLVIPTSWIYTYGLELSADIPKLLWSSTKALFMMRKASKTFIHTPHTLSH